ncbi:hypothetical protein [Microbacterium sp.]|uniref:hypothetical protein n=1 Tax=Microbacterium sp. TaxID=51671 RepID=UPI0039E65788
MAVSAVLIEGADVSALAVAIALAEQGAEVAVVHPAVPLERAASEGAQTDAEAQAALLARARLLGIEVRPGLGVVGCVHVDQYIEAELTNGRIENYDVVIDGLPGRRRIVTGDETRRTAVADVVDRALSAVR